jgi:hypothetical protein
VAALTSGAFTGGDADTLEILDTLIGNILFVAPHCDALKRMLYESEPSISRDRDPCRSMVNGRLQFPWKNTAIV